MRRLDIKMTSEDEKIYITLKEEMHSILEGKPTLLGLTTVHSVFIDVLRHAIDKGLYNIESAGYLLDTLAESNKIKLNNVFNSELNQ